MKNPLARALRADQSPPTPKPTPAVSRESVWKSPVDFNRATRRWAGLIHGIWKWNPQPNPGVPRYVQRHFNETILTHPKTRRQRRHRARILRAMKGRA